MGDTSSDLQIEGPFFLIQFNGVECESIVYVLPRISAQEKKYLEDANFLHAEDLGRSYTDERKAKAFHYVSCAIGMYDMDAFDDDDPNYNEFAKAQEKWVEFREDYNTVNEKYGGCIQAVYAINFTMV